MHLFVIMSRSLVALLVCVIAGWVVGYFWPAVAQVAYLFTQVYLAVVGMAAIPLLVVATFFGLRQVLQTKHAGRRVLLICACGFMLVLACSFVGILGALLFSPGSGLEPEYRQHLGALVLQQGSETEMRLFTHDQIMLPEASAWANAIPSNFFRVLVDGNTLGILLAAVFFGIGFAALPKDQSQTLSRILEASYRALELIIKYANFTLPIVAFGISSQVLASTNLKSLVAMGGFAFYFFCLVCSLCLFALIFISRRSGCSIFHALQSLKEPMLVSLVSSSSAASIPHSIDSLSTKLGFSRGVVELIVPISAVFMRAGSAIYYVLLTAFVAQLYGRELGAAEWSLLCISATVAAFASAGTNSLINVAFATLTLSALHLPAEVALVLFVAIDFLCEGLRNLLSLLMTCVLVAVFAKGKQQENLDRSVDINPVDTPLQLVLTKAGAGTLFLGGLLLAIFVVLAGISVGMRNFDKTFDSATKYIDKKPGQFT